MKSKYQLEGWLTQDKDGSVCFWPLNGSEPEPKIDSEFWWVNGFSEEFNILTTVNKQNVKSWKRCKKKAFLSVRVVE